MAKTVKITESEIRNAVMETFKRIVEDTKAQRRKDPMAKWFSDMDKAQRFRDLQSGVKLKKDELEKVRKDINKEDSFDESISKAVNAVLNEAAGNEHPISKWVYWTFNYHNPEEWLDIFEGAPTEHFMEKWNHCRGDMNRFFVELDSTNQNHLIDYVMNNYTGR